MGTPTRDDFEYWLADMDDALEAFLRTLPEEVAAKLDQSPESLDTLERWILQRYPDTDDMLPESESRTVDGLARYIGETFRGQLGGTWDVSWRDPKEAFYGTPQLTGFWKNATPICPLTLATATADRRSGTYLRGVLDSYRRAESRRSTN